MTSWTCLVLSFMLALLSLFDVSHVYLTGACSFLCCTAIKRSTVSCLCHLIEYLFQTKGNTQRAIDLFKEALSYDSAVHDINERLEGIVAEPERSWCRKKITELQNTTLQ